MDSFEYTLRSADASVEDRDVAEQSLEELEEALGKPVGTMDIKEPPARYKEQIGSELAVYDISVEAELQRQGIAFAMLTYAGTVLGSLGIIHECNGAHARADSDWRVHDSGTDFFTTVQLRREQLLGKFGEDAPWQALLHDGMLLQRTIFGGLRYPVSVTPQLAVERMGLLALQFLPYDGSFDDDEMPDKHDSREVEIEVVAPVAAAVGGRWEA